jgi:hypothetical protein
LTNHQFKEQLQTAVDNVLDLWAVVEPSKILTKYKLHVLTHLKDDIRRFGPAILYSTEVFECWNAVFRLCSVLSNHSAPSLDISLTLPDMERFKHLVSGGWWQSKSKGCFVQAGESVRHILDKNKDVRRRLGLADEDKPHFSTGKFGYAKEIRSYSCIGSLGHVQSIAQAQQIILSNEAVAALMKVEELALQVSVIQQLDILRAGSESLQWIECAWAAARSTDICKANSWVFYSSPDKPPVTVGRICALVRANLSTETGYAIIENFAVSEENDVHYGMPRLTKAGSLTVVDTTVSTSIDSTLRTKLIHSRSFCSSNSTPSTHASMALANRLLSKPKTGVPPHPAQSRPYNTQMTTSISLTSMHFTMPISSGTPCPAI